MIVTDDADRDDKEMPPIDDEEVIARFILFGRYIREDKTVRPEAFMPHPRKTLSAYRICHLREEEIWEGGNGIAAKQGKRLHGRAEVMAGHVRSQNLTATPDKDPKNHITIAGWPESKDVQKLVAQKIAQHSRLVLVGD